MGMWKNRDIWIPASVSAAIILAVTLAVAVILSPEAAGAAAFMGICLFALFMGTAFFREKSIRKLSEELDRILHGEEGLEISHFREGDLEILRDEIAKMTWTLNQQSRRLADDKEQLSRALADISHQIRTPLTSVNLMAERMRRPDISEGEWRKLLREMSHMLGRIGWLGHPFETFPAGCRNCDIETRKISGKQPDRRRPADVCSFHGTSWTDLHCR